MQSTRESRIAALEEAWAEIGSLSPWTRLAYAVGEVYPRCRAYHFADRFRGGGNPDDPLFRATIWAEAVRRLRL